VGIPWTGRFFIKKSAVVLEKTFEPRQKDAPFHQ